MQHILHETLAKVKMLLNSDKTVQSTTERTILKNLGSWLGNLTLARNKPIRHRNVAFKELLIEGFDSNRLIVAIPFVCKVLEGCATSRVFRPPNPWLMGVIGLLMELYHFAEIKLNQKFEIEVLCGTLQIDFEKVDVTSAFRSRPLTDTMAGPALPGDIDSLVMSGYDKEASTDAPALPLSPVDAQRAVGPHIEGILASLANHVVFSHHLGPLVTSASFKEAVQLAIDRSVREVSPYPSHSVTLSLDDTDASIR